MRLPAYKVLYLPRRHWQRGLEGGAIFVRVWNGLLWAEYEAAYLQNQNFTYRRRMPVMCERKLQGRVETFAWAFGEETNTAAITFAWNLSGWPGVTLSSAQWQGWALRQNHLEERKRHGQSGGGRDGAGQQAGSGMNLVNFRTYPGSWGVALGIELICTVLSIYKLILSQCFHLGLTKICWCW